MDIVRAKERNLCQSVTKYSRKMLPEDRRAEELEAKMQNNFLDFSFDGDDAELSSLKKPRLSDTVKAAHVAHTGMCSKSMQTMDNLNELMRKVDGFISKKINDSQSK